jgi:hypothetical protein
MIKPLLFTKSSKAKASEQDIADGERVCGLQFPSSFREFCFRYNGGHPDAQNAVYWVPKEFTDYHEEYSDGLAIEFLYGLTKESDLHCQVLKEDQALADLAIRLFPISGDFMGNQVVIRKEEPEGPVYFRDHEMWDEPQATPHLFKIADNLEQFYNGLTVDPDA